VNAIMSLANNTLGQMITRPLIDSGEILSLSRDVVRPFYQEKSRRAQQLIHQFFEGIPYRIHESGGALFLWLWFEDGSVDTSELYQRLKARQVIIVPGKYFVYGLDEPWEHGNQCVRINFGQEDSVVEEGLKRIADEVRRMRSEA
jgi:valine--pyruvate aminotransferase